MLVRDDEHVVQDAPADGGVGGVEDRAGTGEVDTELLEARAGDDLERVSHLAFIGVRKDFLGRNRPLRRRKRLPPGIRGETPTVAFRDGPEPRRRSVD